MRTDRRVAVPFLLLGLFLVGPIGAPASGHAALVDSDPEPDAAVAALPRSLELEFNEPIGSSVEVAVTAPDGESVEVSSVRADDRFVRADLAASTVSGDFVLAYRVVSVDGHPVSGQYAVTVTEGEEVAADPATVPLTEESFVHRHREHLLWGGLVAVVAIGLVVAPLLRRSGS